MKKSQLRASKFEDLDQAKVIVQSQNLLASIYGDSYVYKVIQRYTEFKVLDENGEEEEIEVREESPAE